MKNPGEITILIVLGLCLSAASAGCVNRAATTTPTTTTTTETTMNNSTSSQPANGLSLSLSLDADTYRSVDTIHMAIDEKNILARMNNVPAAAKWPVSGLSLGICGTLSYPFGIAVYQGFYGISDISTAVPLVIFNPNSVPFGCMPPVNNVTKYIFKPASDIVTINGSGPNESATMEMKTEVDVYEHWAGVPPDAVWHYFEPGVYTVVAGDEWGALVIVHFTVTQ
jgi:hypothetical protein